MLNPRYGTKPTFLRILTRGRQLAVFTMPDSMGGGTFFKVGGGTIARQKSVKNFCDLN